MAVERLDRFIVMVASAKMPAKCWGRYVRVAVVETDGSGTYPKMISERARGVRRIVATWERCNVGTTEACASEMAQSAAHELARKLNEVAWVLPGVCSCCGGEKKGLPSSHVSI